MAKPEREEFIEDRSISRDKDDSFGHRDVVAELAHLALDGPAASNIALFAPWGTGKSGIARLLEPKIEKAGAGFVYFDAFKHRATPLRRSFLRASVAALKPKALDGIDTKLYGEKVTQTLNRSDKWKLFWMVVGGVLGALLITAVITWALSDLHPGPFDKDFPGLFAKTSGVLALVGGLVGVVLTTLVNGYSVTKTSRPVAEDDEFEKEFLDLVKGARGRVVVFVDELDRCSADEVVETLETMRIFLEVERCVFIVAIDQKSLEQALRHRARQETPIDESHPYFSSAGSYVDKIFQYQLSLPPLRSRDMTVFVEGLLEDRDGCWAQIEQWTEKADVVGALTPTHVISPRRVKVLLNAYVMAHRLATKRADVKDMAALQGRASALAQLVCLRTEFSLFADDLEQFPDLPEAMLAQERGETGASIRERAPRTWERAGQYSNGKLPTSRLLLEATRAGADYTNSEAPKAAIDKVNSQQLRNLINYLERVERLPKITADLIYLHSAAGSGTNVEPEIADQLDQAARDGAPESVENVLEEIDASQETEVLRLLISILSSTSTGSLDAENSSHVLLTIAASRENLPRDVANLASDEIVRKIGRRELSERDLASAVELARRCSTTPAAALIRTVSKSGDLLANGSARASLIAADRSLPVEGSKLVGPALANSIEFEDEGSLDAWVELPPERRRALLDAVSKRFEHALKRAEELAEGETANDARSVADLNPHLTWAIDHLLEGSGHAAEEFAAFMLSLLKTEFSSSVEARLERMAPIGYPELRWRAVDRALNRVVDERLPWLINLDERDLDEKSIGKVMRVAAKTWENVVDEAHPQDETVEKIFDECQRLLSDIDPVPTAQIQKVIDVSLKSDFPDEPSAERLLQAIQLSEKLADRGLSNEEKTADSLIAGVVTALGHLEPGQLGARPNVISALEQILPIGREASDESIQSLHQAIGNAPPDTLGEVRLRATIATAAELQRRGAQVPEVALHDLLTQIDNDRAGSASAVSSWASELAPTGAELWAALQRYWVDEVPPEIRDGMRSGLSRLDDGEHRELATLAFEYVIDNGIPQPANWEAISLKGLGATWVIEELKRLVDERDLNESGWRRVLEICLQLKTANSHAQMRIGEKLLLPLASVENYGFRLAVENIGLVGKGNTGQEIIERFGRLANTTERQQLLERQLEGEAWAGATLRKVSSAIRGLVGGKKSEDQD